MEYRRIEYNNIQKIRLAVKNPRFYKQAGIERNLCEFLKEDLEKYSQKEVAEMLLKEEGDLSDFYDLLKNICDYRFDDSHEIILISYYNDKYVVAEGNRRILCLNFLFRHLEFPKIDFFLRENNIYNNFQGQAEFNSLKKQTADELKKKYQKILSLIDQNDFRKQYNQKWFYVTLTENSDFLWKRINSKHGNGEALGLRIWPRGRYFLNLLNHFKNGLPITNEEKKDYEDKLQKRFKNLQSDYEEAQIVKMIMQVDLKDEQSVERILIKSEVSALQRQFWNATLTEYSHQEFGTDWKEVKINYFHVKFDERKKILPQKVEEKFLRFLKKWFLLGVLTTRTKISNLEKKEHFIKDLGKLLEKKNFNKIDFDNKYRNEEKRRRFAKNIKKSIFKLLIDLRDFPFVKKIMDLFEQFEYTAKSNKYIHATAATLRTILEFFVVFSVFCIDENEGSNKDLIIKIHDLKTHQETIKNIVSKPKFDARELIRKVTNKSLLQPILTKFTNEESAKKLKKQYGDRWILNDIIHRLFFNPKTEKYLTDLEVTLYSFFENIDKNQLKNLEEKIKQYSPK